MAVTNTAKDFGDEPGQKVHLQCPSSSVPRYLSPRPPFGSRDHTSTLVPVVPKRGAERQQGPGLGTQSLSCVGGTFLSLLLFLSAKPAEVNTKQLWCSEVTFWSMCSSPWTSAKATIVDFMPRLGRTLAPSHCFLWPGSMDSQPGKKAPF